MAITKKVAAQLEGKFTKVARTFARNHKIQVRLSGTRCDTTADGVINLPANSDYLSDDNAEILEGLLDHEWSHQAEESEAKVNPAFPSPLKVMDGLKSNKEKLLLNVFEDIRIEMKQGERYIGVAENLRKQNLHLTEKLLKPRILGKEKDKSGRVAKFDPWWAIGCGIIASAREMDMTWFPPQYQELIAFLSDEIEASRKLKDANGSLRLARKVIEKLKDAGEDSEPGEETGDMGGEGEPGAEKEDKTGKSKQKGKSKKSDEKGSEKGEASGEGEDGEEEGESESGKGDEGEGSAGGEGGEGEDGEEEGGSGEGEGKSLSEKAKDAARELGHSDATVDDLVDEAKAHIEKASEYDIKTNDRHIPHPEILAHDTVEKAAKGSESAIIELSNEVRPAVSALRAKILTVMQSRKERRFIGDQERGGVDPSTLYSLRLGNKRVFTTRTPDIDVDTVVGILVDQSGSMGGSGYGGGGTKSNMARKAVISLSETLDKVHIPFGVWGFDNGYPDRALYDRSYYSGSARRGHPLYNRFSPLQIQVYKSFDEQYRAVRTRLQHITGRGDNTDGEAVQWVARELHHRRESRKILMVLSDGMPACSDTDFNLLGKHLKEVVEATSNAGIEVFGIGIQTDAVKQFYPDYTIVNDINDLAPNTFRMMKKYLLAKKPSRHQVARRSK